MESLKRNYIIVIIDTPETNEYKRLIFIKEQERMFRERLGFKIFNTIEKCLSFTRQTFIFLPL
jgi:hypothetical protein